MNVNTVLAFTDAVKIARGCHDYGGGYQDSKEYEIFHHGIQTVINVLEACVKEGGMDAQARVCFKIGSTAAPQVQPDPLDVAKDESLNRQRDRREAIEREAIAAFVKEVWRVAEAEKLTTKYAIKRVCEARGIAI